MINKLSTAFTTVKYTVRKIRFWINPFHCVDCGVRMYVHNPEYKHFPGQDRPGHSSELIVQNISPDSVCRQCTIKHLEANEWVPRFTHLHQKKRGAIGKDREGYRFWSKKKCDCCGQQVRSFKDVEMHPKISMLFCNMAWNYGYICKRCVIDTIKNGYIKTSMIGTYKGSFKFMNSKGLYVDQQGKLL